MPTAAEQYRALVSKLESIQEQGSRSPVNPQPEDRGVQIKVLQDKTPMYVYPTSLEAAERHAQAKGYKNWAYANFDGGTNMLEVHAQSLNQAREIAYLSGQLTYRTPETSQYMAYTPETPKGKIDSPKDEGNTGIQFKPTSFNIQR